MQAFPTTIIPTRTQPHRLLKERQDRKSPPKGGRKSGKPQKKGFAWVPFLWKLRMKGYQNRTVGIVENGTWAPMAAKAMTTLLEPLKNVRIVEPVVSLRSTLRESDIPALEELAEAMTSAK